jgi:hypothetical protein
LENEFVQIGFADGSTVGQGTSGVPQGVQDVFVGSALLPGGGDIRARVGPDSDDGNSASSVAYADDTTYMIVLKLEKDGSSKYNKATLFVDPTSETESGGTTATFDTGVDSVSHLMIRQDIGDSFDQMNIDEIVVAPTFAEAVTPIPEPATLGLLALGGLMGLTAMRRRRRG